ncbi:MAG: trypsin-like peptidase domain-containing protein [Candidatus Dormibacteraeota bacterium]|nr:trypsin-like peptidase domain-containing protein [Candidatus Dormibacteraeota bacterium]
MQRGDARTRLMRLAGTLLALGCGFALTGCTATTTTTSTASPTTTNATSGRSDVPPAPAAAGSAFDPQHVADVLGPAVAIVIVKKGTATGEGSGFVIAHSGSQSYMVTNNHVIESGGRIQVLMLDGRHFVAQVKGADPLGDIAVLSIPDATLPIALFADSTRLRVGQQVVAIGSPLGNQGSVTSGIISALHRSITAGGSVSGPSERLADVLQTDAAINPGNSGGPLADADGRVVGVNTAVQSNASNVGFAIPSAVAKRIADALIAGRKPGHPFLGVSFADESEALAAGADFPGYGVLVREVVPNSAADKAGVKNNDVIQKMGGVELRNGQTLGGVLQLHEVGEHVKLTILRGGQTQELDCVLNDRPPNA